MSYPRPSPLTFLNAVASTCTYARTHAAHEQRSAEPRRMTVHLRRHKGKERRQDGSNDGLEGGLGIG